jgi:hypothetical protein
MRKLIIGTGIGTALATGCGMAGLDSLSATVFTVTVFFGTQALIVVALDAFPRTMRRPSI